MLLTIVKAIITNLPEIAKATFELIQSLLTTIIKNLPQILEAGIEIIGELIAGLLKALPDVLKAMWDILQAIGKTITEIDWLGLGWDIISGIAKGISSAAGKIWEAVKAACSEAWEKAKDFFKIGSPSKLMENTIGRMIPQGMAIGIEEDSDYVTKAMHNVAAESVEASQEVPYFGDVQPMTTSNSSSVTFNNVFNINGTDRDPRELAEEISYYLEADRQRVAGVWA
jgi:phage-related protein